MSIENNPNNHGAKKRIENVENVPDHSETSPTPPPLPESPAKKSFLEKVKDYSVGLGRDTFEKVQQKAANWRDDLVDSIKLKTVDKWQMMMDRSSENRLINREKLGISRSDKERMDLINRRQEELSIQGKNVTLAQSLLNSTSDPKLRQIAEAKIQATRQLEGRVKERYGTPIQAFESRINEAKGRVEAFEARVKDIEKFAVNKIDNKVEEIRQRYGYEELVNKREKAKEVIKEAGAEVQKNEKRRTEIETFLESKSLFSKEEVSELKKELKETKEALKTNRKSLERAQKSEQKVSGCVSKVEARIGKWNKIKDKYKFQKIDPKQSHLDRRFSATTSEITPPEREVTHPVGGDEEPGAIKITSEDSNDENNEKINGMEELIEDFDRFSKVVKERPLSREKIMKAFDSMFKKFDDLGISGDEGEESLQAIYKTFDKMKRFIRINIDRTIDRQTGNISKEVDDAIEKIEEVIGQLK